MDDDIQQRSIVAARRIAHTPPLSTLAGKVRASHTALVVVDMQNDFCASDGFVAKGGRDVSFVQKMAGQLSALLDSARSAGVTVIFVRCSYSSEDNRYLSDVWLEQAVRRQGGGYTLWPVCQDGTEGAKFYGVEPEPGEPVIVKHRYDAFHGTELELLLRSRGVRTVVLTGVSTHVCVETTARASFIRDFYTVVVGDCSAAYSQEEHEASLRIIDRFFGEITDLNTLRQLWLPSQL